MKIQVEPSILSGDFGHLAEEVQRIEAAGADAVHVDIMDGHFVPNLTLGPRAVAAIKRATRQLFIDVHLMIYNPYDYVEAFVQAGANRITFHLEATEDVADTLAYIRTCNIEAGLAFSPKTSESLIPKYLDQCDLVLLMTVEPGFGGQAFIPQVLEKIQFTRSVCERLQIKKAIQVDGGIDLVTGRQCVEAGADVLVSGSYLFKQPDLAKAIAQMKQLGEAL